MEHIVVGIRPGQGPEVVAWAVRHALACGGGLEIIASGLEWPDPRGALREVGRQLVSTGSGVPFALRTVAVGMAAALAHSPRGVDLIVLGWRSARRVRAEATSLIAIASVSGCPVVIVPRDWQAVADAATAPLIQPVSASGGSKAVIDMLCAGRVPIRLVPTSFADESRPTVSG